MKFFKLVLILTVFSLLIYATDKSAANFVNNLISYSYCDKPIRYRIDTVDPKFNLNREAFASDITAAGQIWSKAEGKTLFVYDPEGILSINMIYDERQSLSNQINQLEGNLQSNQHNLEPQITQYKKDVANFKQKLTDFNKIVSDWNNKGGAPSEEYDKLVKQQQDLQVEAENLNKIAASLNQSTENYNTEVGQLNKTVQTFNQALQLRPEEGLYKAETNRIEIYFNVSQTELIHTLAHEMGHSLGMEHVSNQKAMMYSRTNQQLVPTPDDLSQLEQVCKEHNVFEVAINYYSEIISSWKTSLLKP
ncbi:MAG: matrixin family metalloprotease [Candidatus Daviesbacteria bacterium]|nr:matrixin family metalloprotease [Candidatus Daviesbacteria bacterium]